MTKDTTDTAGDSKFKRAVDWVQQSYDDRWPARGKANNEGRDYRPLEDVSREGSCTPYRKWPTAK